jgi:Dolichyl-phosphate-mannose-protein mannosyltransferase
MTRRANLIFFALLIVIIVLALPVLTYPPGRDQGEFATIGRGILDGKIPYIDLWNPKPPAVFYVYALAIRIFGRTAESLRAIDFFVVPAICAALYWLGGRIANWRVGLFAGLLFGVFYFTESFWTLTQNDGIVALPMTLAMVCAFKAAENSKRGWIWAFGAGALSAYAVWFKYPFALFSIALVLGYMFINMQPQKHDEGGTKRRKFALSVSPTEMWLTFFAFFIGFVNTIGIGIFALIMMGAWGDLVESVRVTSQYTALTFNFQDFTGLMATAIGFRWQQWGPLWILVVLWFVLRGDRSRQWFAIIIWALAGLGIMLVQAKGYDYHWLPMLPPLALLGADGLDRILKKITNRLQTPATMTAILILFALMIVRIWPNAWPYLTGQESQVVYYGRFQAGEFIADESLQVANLLRERVLPGDSLYIWGFRPEVYYLSQLNPPTRFIFQFPLVAKWYPPEWREENAEILWAALPPYVLVLQVDYMPWVTGSEEDSNTLLQEYNELNDWLVFNYEFDTQVGNFFIWRRKT